MKAKATGPVLCPCPCGKEAKPVKSRFDEMWWVGCSDDDCTWSSTTFPTEAEAVAAWSAVMRPRPVVTMRKQRSGAYEFETGDDFSLGCYDPNCEDAECYFTNESYTDDDPRAWLIAKLQSAGFDVQEASDDTK